MTATALHADAGSARRGRQALLWVVPLTASWIVVNYWQPGLQASGVPTTAFRLMTHVLIALALWLALERSTMAQAQRRAVWLAVMVPYTLWLAVIWSAAVNGVFRPGNGPPLLPLAIFVPVIIGTPLLLRSRRIGDVLDAMPESWLVALQLYRVIGSVFLVGWALGAVPGEFALPAGIGDTITGLLAVPTALWLASGSADARKAAIAWNVFGLLDFAVAVGIALMIAPGPLQVIAPTVPNAGAGLYPTVMIPAFGVPTSILLHALSLRQLRRRAPTA
jgi:hypothetical protein